MGMLDWVEKQLKYPSFSKIDNSLARDLYLESASG